MMITLWRGGQSCAFHGNDGGAGRCVLKVREDLTKCLRTRASRARARRWVLAGSCGFVWACKRHVDPLCDDKECKAARADGRRWQYVFFHGDHVCSAGWLVHCRHTGLCRKGVSWHRLVM